MAVFNSLLIRLLVAVTFFLQAQQVSAQAPRTCYYPDGSVASNHSPCGDSNSCCYYPNDAHRHLCYDNGFCYALYSGYLYRGACTDKSWGKDSGCATECLDENRNKDMLITHCKASTGADHMCCGEPSADSNCCSGTDHFNWANASFINLPQAQVSVQVSTSTSATATSGITTSAASSYTSTASCNAVINNEQDLISSKNPQCSNHDVALGAGLGVPLIIFVLSTLFLATQVFRSRPKANDTQIQEAPSSPSHSYVQVHHIGVRTKDPELSAEPKMGKPAELPAYTSVS